MFANASVNGLSQTYYYSFARSHPFPQIVALAPIIARPISRHISDLYSPKNRIFTIFVIELSFFQDVTDIRGLVVLAFN